MNTTELAEWQTDETRLNTRTVQYWRNGIMMTAMMTKENAKKLVVEGKAFIITSQAIGCIENECTFA